MRKGPECDNCGNPYPPRGLAERDARIARLEEALRASEEHLTSCTPSDSRGCLDRDADADRSRALALVRAALEGQ